SDIDGQFVETGVGISYVRDFDKWTNFFRRTKVEKGKLKKLKKNDKLNPKELFPDYQFSAAGSLQWYQAFASR
ncbi:MAG TPA: hypothetical protein VLQ91_05520, partial [Draconibacterium sp.]|nr:hypothetical protein [Draconibacterium sp.]